jgi:hypothetical protein
MKYWQNTLFLSNSQMPFFYVPANAASVIRTSLHTWNPPVLFLTKECLVWRLLCTFSFLSLFCHNSHLQSRWKLRN